MGAGGVIPPPAGYFDKVSCLYHEMIDRCQSLYLKLDSNEIF